MRESRVIAHLIAHLAHRHSPRSLLRLSYSLYASRETVFLVAGLELHFAHMPHTHAAKYDTDYVLRHHNTEHSLDTPPDGPRSAELYSSIALTRGRVRLTHEQRSSAPHSTVIP